MYRIRQKAFRIRISRQWAGVQKAANLNEDNVRSEICWARNFSLFIQLKFSFNSNNNPFALNLNIDLLNVT